MMDAIVRDNGTTNPLIEIPEQMLLDWLRKVADDAGYADRSMSAVQVGIPDAGEGKRVTFLAVPELVVMVSNIKGSRSD